MLVAKGELIEYVLSKLLQECPHIDGAIVVDRDGQLIGSKVKSGKQAEPVGTLSSLIMENGLRATNELEQGELEDIIIMGKNGYSIFVNIKDFGTFSVYSQNKQTFMPSYDYTHKAALALFLLTKEDFLKREIDNIFGSSNVRESLYERPSAIGMETKIFLLIRSRDEVKGVAIEEVEKIYSVPPHFLSAMLSQSYLEFGKRKYTLLKEVSSDTSEEKKLILMRGDLAIIANDIIGKVNAGSDAQGNMVLPEMIKIPLIRLG